MSDTAQSAGADAGDVSRDRTSNSMAALATQYEDILKSQPEVYRVHYSTVCLEYVWYSFQTTNDYITLEFFEAVGLEPRAFQNGRRTWPLPFFSWGFPIPGSCIYVLCRIPKEDIGMVVDELSDSPNASTAALGVEEESRDDLKTPEVDG